METETQQPSPRSKGGYWCFEAQPSGLGVLTEAGEGCHFPYLKSLTSSLRRATERLVDQMPGERFAVIAEGGERLLEEGCGSRCGQTGLD